VKMHVEESLYPHGQKGLKRFKRLANSGFCAK
jgi:hypothetical protein